MTDGALFQSLLVPKRRQNMHCLCKQTEIETMKNPQRKPWIQCDCLETNHNQTTKKSRCHPRLQNFQTETAPSGEPLHAQMQCCRVVGKLEPASIRNSQIQNKFSRVVSKLQSTKDFNIGRRWKVQELPLAATKEHLDYSSIETLHGSQSSSAIKSYIQATSSYVIRRARTASIRISFHNGFANNPNSLSI